MVESTAFLRIRFKAKRILNAHEQSAESYLITDLFGLVLDFIREKRGSSRRSLYALPIQI